MSVALALAVLVGGALGSMSYRWEQTFLDIAVAVAAFPPPAVRVLWGEVYGMVWWTFPAADADRIDGVVDGLLRGLDVLVVALFAGLLARLLTHVHARAIHVPPPPETREDMRARILAHYDAPDIRF